MRAARYELPLAKPLRLGSEHVEVRCGWLVRSGGAGGPVADACPLPGFSPETIGDVEAALSGSGASTASLGWAIRTLQLSGDADVRTAGLATTPDEAVGLGFGCVKLKVGRLPLDAETAAVRGLRTSGVRLRLDGNRALSLDAAERLADAAGAALEFFEEPVPRRDLEAAIQRMPIALDETLAEVSSDAIPAGAAAFVLKPLVLGATLTETLVERAGRLGVPVIVSSSYESAIGRAALIRYAATVAPDVAHGLGTGPAFARDFDGWVREDGDRLFASDGEVPEGLRWVSC